MRFVAGRGAVAELLTEGAAAKSHREDVAGRDAVAERWYGQPAEAAGRGAVAKKLATPWRRAIGKKLLTGSTAVAKMLQAGAPDARFLIQQRCPVQKAFRQKSNC